MRERLEVGDAVGDSCLRLRRGAGGQLLGLKHRLTDRGLAFCDGETGALRWQ